MECVLVAEKLNNKMPVWRENTNGMGIGGRELCTETEQPKIVFGEKIRMECVLVAENSVMKWTE